MNLYMRKITRAQVEAAVREYIARGGVIRRLDPASLSNRHFDEDIDLADNDDMPAFAIVPRFAHIELLLGA